MRSGHLRDFELGTSWCLGLHDTSWDTAECTTRGLTSLSNRILKLVDLVLQLAAGPFPPRGH